MRTLKKPDTKWGSLKEVTEWYRKEKNIQIKIKLHAIRLLMLDYSRKEIAEILDVSESSIRNWRQAWNKSGIDGLNNNYVGRKSKITPEMRAEIEDIIEIEEEIDGKKITGYLIEGYIKKTEYKYQLFSCSLYFKADGISFTSSTYMAIKAG